MKRDNYKAWKIKELDFPWNGTVGDKIKFMLGYAILAPSTFNCQPWKCKVVENKVEVYLDTGRMTQQSDKTGRFAFISLGCFIENFLIAAEFYGFAINLEFNTRLSNNAIRLIASISVTEEDKKASKKIGELGNLIYSITLRATNRSYSIQKEVSKKLFNKIEGFKEKGQDIVVLGKDHRKDLLEISLVGDKETWGNYAFRKEHVVWVRHNLTRAYDGMPAFGVGVGFIPSFLAYPIILSPIFPNMQAKKNFLLLKSTPHFLILCSKEDTFEWVKIGMLYERIALYLTSKGIAVPPLGHFIESDSARDKLGKLGQCNKGLNPQLFFRLGFPLKPVSHSPRFPVDKILI